MPVRRRADVDAAAREVFAPRPVFVIVGAFFPEFMAIRLGGNITLGLILGLLQFVTTFLITFAYVRFSNRTLDPRATALRERLEREAAGAHENPEATR